MEIFTQVLNSINSVIWHDYVLYIVLGTGVLFTFWSGFCQYRAVTHGVSVTLGRYDDKSDPGAINHFQALSAALSATVGLGNIGGVALAIALGGPGAVFWMWMIGLAGMALKTTEVTLSMLYRNTENPDNPHGGPMFVAAKAFGEKGLPVLGKLIGGTFVFTLLISTITGGNMFQAWNVADVTRQYFEIPQIATGIILSVLVGLVIIGGIKRIGNVAGRLVPFMGILYLLGALYVLVMNFSEIPYMLKLIVTYAFSPAQAEGAFIGGTAGYAFLWGMKRALFSSESGQGSSPIAHSAAKTDEPVREAVVAGLEPFIDTLVVCTLTTLVILATGVWDRGPDLEFTSTPNVVQMNDDMWSLERTQLVTIEDPDLRDGADLFVVIKANENPNSGKKFHRLSGAARQEGENYFVEWSTHESPTPVELVSQGAFFNYKGATLTAKAFDRTAEGLGKWLVSLAAWLFAISTMISWSYYGEQGVVFLAGEKWVMGYKLLYCGLIIVATIPALISTDAELDALTALGTGVMLWANIPIMLTFGAMAMRAYWTYMGKLKAGEFQAQKMPSIFEVARGKDVE